MKYHEWVLEARRRSKKDNIKIPTIPASTSRDREKRLKASGLLEWDRFWLVSHKLDSPGMREMLKERKVIFNRAKDSKLSITEYRSEISRLYRRRGWTFNNGNFNPFDMLAHYRDKINADITPTPKKKHKRKDYLESKRKTQAKVQPEAHYLFKPRRLF